MTNQKVIKVYVDSDLYTRVTAFARFNQISTSEWCRDFIKGAMEEVFQLLPPEQLNPFDDPFDDELDEIERSLQNLKKLWFEKP